MSGQTLNFDAKSVPLKGTNLIEASAGTGKTYSIAILVLRILLELDVQDTTDGPMPKYRNISIKEILMVTFTKAAVAELEERVRKFIRKAYAVSQKGECDDPSIIAVVQSAIQAKGEVEVYNRLHEAVIFLDESSVQTIHSFCQQMLREFAFETRQSFSVELVTDMSLVIQRELNQFWRSGINVMPLDILQLFGQTLTRENLKKVIIEFFAGKPIYDYDPDRAYVLDEAFYEYCRAGAAALQQQIQTIEADMQEICKDRDAMEAACNGDKNAKQSFLPLIDHPKAFLELFMTKMESSRPPAYIHKCFAALAELAERLIPLRTALRTAMFELLQYIYAAAIAAIAPSIERYKQKHGQLCFDDLIGQLHARLCQENNPALIRAMQNKYRVVFIDEFQDTDKLQYEIFNTAFGSGTVVFYIGDPKQSIYAFRKADIDTYLKAGEQVDHKYGMHVNYRSTDDFIDAMNHFFMPAEDFDTFYYKDQPLGIHYHRVEAPENNPKGQILLNGEAFPVINITEAGNATAIVHGLAAQVAELLSGAYKIAPIGEDPRPVKPTDIGILIKKNKDAQPLKRSLSRLGIPSVVIGDAKILESPEAKELLYVLEAIMAQTRNAINKALLTSFTGLAVEQVLRQNDVITIERFGSYKVQLERGGVYNALFSFIADYGIERYLTAPTTRGGERIISNLYQLIELLYKQQSNKKLSPVELADWLRRSIEDPRAEGDEYEQRIESDDQCVTIITVHKSKGLQFNIVLTPGMDLLASASNARTRFLVFKNESGEERLLPKEVLLEEDLEVIERQKMQENRRMIYVNLTRAVYACYIYTSLGAKPRSKLAINEFLEAFKAHPTEGIRFLEPVELPEHFRYHRSGPSEQAGRLPATDVHFDLVQRDWRRLSYTYLAAAPASYGRFEMTTSLNDYDQFVFQKLHRGNITGNLLHHIFEHIYFEYPAYWPSAINKAVERFAPHERTLYEPMLLALVKHVAEAIIKSGQMQFSLKDTQFEKRLHEFEFDFPVAQFKRRDLARLLGDSTYLQTVTTDTWEGMMNGKIDMLFEQGGKYYIMDWKSTFLGSGIADYAPEKLEAEMMRHNYHLQYLIYTVATVKYLKDRLAAFDYDRDFGGVLYFFVRGARGGQSTGIYFTKPAKAVISQLLDLWSKEVASSPF